jgi:hypothetical protein
MKYKGIGFNGPHLAAMPFEQFSKEVAHQLNEAEQKDCYSLLQLKYPGVAKVAPVSHDDTIAISEVTDAGSTDGSGDNEQPGTNKRGARKPER